MAERFGMLMPAFRLAACFLRTARFFPVEKEVWGELPARMNQCYRLGIDIGSTTVKVAVIDDNNKIFIRGL